MRDNLFGVPLSPKASHVLFQNSSSCCFVLMFVEILFAKLDAPRFTFWFGCKLSYTSAFILTVESASNRLTRSQKGMTPSWPWGKANLKEQWKRKRKIVHGPLENMVSLLNFTATLSVSRGIPLLVLIPPSFGLTLKAQTPDFDTCRNLPETVAKSSVHASFEWD